MTYRQVSDGDGEVSGVGSEQSSCKEESLVRKMREQRGRKRLTGGSVPSHERGKNTKSSSSLGESDDGSRSGDKVLNREEDESDDEEREDSDEGHRRSEGGNQHDEAVASSSATKSECTRQSTDVKMDHPAR